MRRKLSLFLLSLVVTSACGVKGRPLPPLTAPQIGRGEPSLLGTQAEPLQTPQQKKKNNQDDFEDDADF
jgi:hypothetical protein